MIDRYGESGAALVVFLHGSPANRKAALGIARALPPGIELLVPDLPGHGSRAGEPFAIDRSLEVLAETIAREGRPAVVAGDSLGGYLALAAGSRVPGVMAVVAGGCTFEMRGAASRLALASDLPLRLARRIAGARCLGRAIDFILPYVIDRESARAVSAAGLRLEARGESIRALAALDTGALVEACHVPIVFVNGSRDWPTRAGERRFLARARAAELVLAAGSPHGASLFAPAVFAAAIVRAVARGRDGSDMIGGPDRVAGGPG